MKKPLKPVRSFRQHTLKNTLHCTGVGLHTGQNLKMSIHAAKPNTGIVFRRTDIDDRCNEIAARYDNVGDTQLCTTLRNKDGVTIGTVEHLMAAMAGCEIDNAIVDLNGPEVPIMDGSAEPFVFLIESMGIVEQNEPRSVIKILRRIGVKNGSSEMILEPSEGFSISLGIDYTHPSIGRQNLTLNVSSTVFKSQISRARTFGFLNEIESLRTAGYGLGGSLENAVVVDSDGVMNEDGLRYTDEFVRHKALDCIGDFYLLGAPIQGHVSGYRIGHTINNLLLRTLIADQEAWQSVTMDELLTPKAAQTYDDRTDWHELSLAAHA